MTITINDLKLLESENMTNSADGGGGCSNTVIIDGMSNNMFDDISQQDRVYGKVNERKAFVGVRSLNTDKLFSAMAYVSKLPKDTNINVNLFKSQNWSDKRLNRVVKKTPQLEKYNHKILLDEMYFSSLNDAKYGFSIDKAMSLFVTGSLAVNAKTIIVCGIDGMINSDYCYGVEGLKKILLNTFLIDDGTNSEYVAVKSVEINTYVNSFTITNGVASYQNNIETYQPTKKYTATLTLAYGLKNNYTGADANDSSTWLAAPAKLYTLKSVDESKFYTAKRLQSALSENATTITLSDGNNQIIPLVNGVPLNSETLGIDATSFAADGNYQAFSAGDVVIILNDKETTGTYSAGQTVTLTRQNLAKITVRDSAGNLVDTAKFTVDLTAGTITFVNLTGVSQPLKITDRIEDFGLVTSVPTGNILTLYKPIKHAYPIDGTIVSNCCLFGTLFASVTKPFDQQTWTNVWSDTVVGSTVSAEYNFLDYPIVVNNYNAVTDRWAIIFTSATQFNVLSETRGQIATGMSITLDCAPINPATNQPYFTLPAAGFGGGFSSGNVIRFNTIAAAAPFWVLQSISQGEATDPDFDFAIEVRGDIDAA